MENTEKSKRRVDPRLQAMARVGDWMIISKRLGINRASIDNNRFGRSDRQVTEIENALVELFEERRAADEAAKNKIANLVNSQS